MLVCKVVCKFVYAGWGGGVFCWGAIISSYIYIYTHIYIYHPWRYLNAEKKGPRIKSSNYIQYGEAVRLLDLETAQ